MNKNLRLLLGKPLLAHTIEAARATGCARVIVTTNCEEIAGVARKYGADVPFLRPDSLSQATSSSVSAIVHALLWLEQHEQSVPKYVGFCPPTNPFIRAESLKGMFALLAERSDRNSVVTISPPKTHPFRIVQKESDGTIKNGIVSIDSKTINDIERSQDWPVVWEGSPACRMTRAQYFLNFRDQPLESVSGKTYDVNSALGYPVSAREAMDIDTEEDFALAEALAATSRAA